MSGFLGFGLGHAEKCATYHNPEQRHDDGAKETSDDDHNPCLRRVHTGEINTRMYGKYLSQKHSVMAGKLQQSGVANLVEIVENVLSGLCAR